MFIINITVKDTISPEQHESLFIRHAQWFKHHFSTGKFIVIGPYSDRERSGVIIANIENRDELMTILSEDSYYPNLATYEISEFIPKMIAENLHQFQKS
ncbi:YCII domain-containing protein [Yersinia frederiksenii]|uniref:YciI family protein n=1 Tax=Yersinia frederiksenii TaxID=29484 RepID=UPI0005E3DCEF|nr:hypothetical protein [Yersinia frederiksenii]CNC80359.1 YCII domain-containing protein [Yersinia frederiksenii]